jgi:hypothetical protein
MIAALFRF